MSEIADPPPTGGEQVTAVIGGLTRLSGFMGIRQKRYTLVVTDRRIVFAELTKDRVSELTHQASDDAKTAGKGLLGKVGAQMRSIDGVAAAYREMSADAALGETATNFAIERSAIRKVKFKSETGAEGQGPYTEYVVIKTGSETYKLQVSGSLRQVRESFGQAGIS